MGRSLRAVIVIDFEAETLADASKFDAALKKQAKILCETIADPSSSSDDDLHIISHQAEVLLSERRGKTGPVSNIVFRGTRGPNQIKIKPLLIK